MEHDTDYTVNLEGSNKADPYKVRLTWGKTIAKALGASRVTDDLLTFLVSRAQFVTINMTQILISAVCYYDAYQLVEKDEASSFDDDLVKYISTTFKDEKGEGT